MKGGTMYEQKDIILIPFPYSDLTGSKKRPALIISNQKLNKSDVQLIEDMKLVRKIVEMGLGQRKLANIKVRQPLRQMTVDGLSLGSDLEKLILDELNIKKIIWAKNKSDFSVILDLDLDSQLVAEGKLRELVRQVQDKRKELGAKLDQKINLTLSENLEEKYKLELSRQTLVQQINIGSEFAVQLL